MSLLDPRLDGRLLHELRQPPEDGRVCVGWHTVPKVEYMTRPPAGTRENSSGRSLDPLPRAEQNGRIEIALDAAVGAGADLPRDVAGELVGELVHQRVPDVPLAVHERLDLRELAARPPLDEVARDRERAAAESDHRPFGRELRA